MSMVFLVEQQTSAAKLGEYVYRIAVIRELHKFKLYVKVVRWNTFLNGSRNNVRFQFAKSNVGDIKSVEVG